MDRRCTDEAGRRAAVYRGWQRGNSAGPMATVGEIAQRRSRC